MIDFRQESSGADYKVKFSLNLAKDDQVGLIVGVVNAAGAVRHALESNPADAEKQDILKALLIHSKMRMNLINGTCVYRDIPATHVRGSGNGGTCAGLYSVGFVDSDVGSCGRGKQG
ncbi:MAG: hypothetical protein V8R91_05550 [Butyricimonas faecihominis]